MLQFNFERIFKARGIESPSIFLQKDGFSQNFTKKIITGNARSLRLSTLERLCLLLKCTPNDVIEWIPDKNSEVDKKHPINEIKKSTKVADIIKILSTVPISKVEEIGEMINESIKNN